MDKKDNMPIWRKVLVAICSLLTIACLILVGNIMDYYLYFCIRNWIVVS